MRARRIAPLLAAAVVVVVAAAAAAAPPAGVASAAVAPPTAPALVPGPVTVHPVDPALLAALGRRASPGGPGGAMTISVTVRAGTLSVEPASVVVELGPGDEPGTLVGTAAVEVVDARGSFAGWVLRADAPHGIGVDAAIEVVDGDPDGLRTWSNRGGGRGPHRLAAARRGHGAGTFAVNLLVTGVERHLGPGPVTVTISLNAT